MVVVRGPAIADLGINPEAWLFLTLLMCVTLFFKFGRFWSVRNLDLLMIFALAPGMLRVVGLGHAGAWWAYLWLFVGSFLWMIRCLLDLGLTRRPMLEPNLNASGLACLAVGIVGLFIVEMVNLPFGDAPKVVPSGPSPRPDEPTPESPPGEQMVDEVIHRTPLALVSSPDEQPRVILRRVIAMLAQVGLVVALITVGWRHFDRPTTGFSVATCYLLLPYARFALTDSGQLVPSALVVAAVACYQRPLVAGILIGLAAGWMPACLGLVPLWAGFYRRRGIGRFLATAGGLLVGMKLLGQRIPSLAAWARALGSTTMTGAGVWPGEESPVDQSFWAGLDANYRLPVQIAYLILVVILTFLPRTKNLGELIALSAALLVGAQFWYLEAGGTLVVLYLPLVVLMMFRPNLALRPTFPRAIKANV